MDRSATQDGAVTSRLDEGDLPAAVARLRTGLESGEVERMPTEIVVTMSELPAGVTPRIGDILVDPVLLAEATGEASGISHPVIGMEVVMVDETTPDTAYLTVIRLVEATGGPASF